MDTKKYSTSKRVAIFYTALAAIGFGIAIFSGQQGFQFDSLFIFAILFLPFMFFNMVYGVYVTLSDNIVVRTDNFLFKTKLPVTDIEMIRYQPTYGVGKEASSLYIFRKNQNTAVLTMTNLWFTEKTLNEVLYDIKKLNPSIIFDSEAEALVKKYANNGDSHH